VTGAFANATIIVSLVVAAWALVHLLIGRPMSRWLHASQLVIAAMFVVLAAGGIVQMLGTDRDFARIEFVGYLVISPIIPIGSWLWTRGDRTRIGSAIVMVVGLVMPVLVLRIQQVWAGAPVG
jgi:membrane-associated phospholipid phosphatase